jgi:hypothetical protein
VRIGQRRSSKVTVVAAGAAGVLLAGYGWTTLSTAAASGTTATASDSAHVKVLAPDGAHNAGIGGKGWFVDLRVDYQGGLAASGFTAEQLTGPAGHNNVTPFPGTFSPGRDDRLPGVVVLTSTTNSTLSGFSGPGTNLANLFNLTGVTDRSGGEAQIWDTWIVGAPIAGSNVDSILTVAVVADLNHDGILNDAPNVVTDQNGDGRVDQRDLKLLGVASNIETVRFHINADPA